MGVDIHQERLLPIIRDFEEVARLSLNQVGQIFHVLLRSIFVNVAFHHVSAVVDVYMLV